MRDGLPAEKKANHQGNGPQLERKRPSSTLHCWRMAGCYASMTLPGQAWAPPMEVTRGKAIAAAKPILRTAKRDAKDTQPALSVNEQIGISPTGPGPAAPRIRPLRADSCLESVLVSAMDYVCRRIASRWPPPSNSSSGPHRVAGRRPGPLRRILARGNPDEARGNCRSFILSQSFMRAR